MKARARSSGSCSSSSRSRSTAFGLVMVYSATSASAALGNGNPTGYLEAAGDLRAARRRAARRRCARRLPQAARARTDARRSSRSALCLAVLVVGTRINGARRWIGSARRRSSRPSSRSSRSSSGRPRTLARRPAPRTLRELARPIGCSSASSALLVLAEPDLGTVITLVVDGRRDPARLRDAAADARRRVRASSSALGGSPRSGRAVPPRAPLQLPRPVEGPAGRGLPERAGA